jgi:hypothetical protein
MRETGHEAAPDRIGDVDEHDWDGAGLLLQNSRDLRTWAHDDIGGCGHDVHSVGPSQAVVDR